MIIPNIWKNQKWSKPPTRLILITNKCMPYNQLFMAIDCFQHTTSMSSKIQKWLQYLRWTPDGKSPPPYKGSQMCYPLHVYIFLPCLAVREFNTQSSPIDEKHQSSRFAIAIPGRPGLKRCWSKEKCRCFLGDQDYTRFIQRYIYIYNVPPPLSYKLVYKSH